jgi:formylglycine-generating enzyme required for sulfatase activity
MDPLLLTLAPGVELRLVHVPAGEFTMGSSDGDKEADDNEKPQRRVYLDDYLIGKAPVTGAQWRAFVQATDYQWDPSALRSGVGDHPVTQVTWDEAVAFCAWASEATGRIVRLPTEAEWEKAARGTDGRIYPWGNQTDLANRCNYGLNVGDTTPVGRYSPQGDSPYGCVDMTGNVWEWVADYYADRYYSSTPARNPTGPASGIARVLRGGSWDDQASDVRAAYRFIGYQRGRYFLCGFRVAASPILL